MAKQIGPTVKLELSCFDCEHCTTQSYTCQGDSGSDVFCAAVDNRRIGDTTWKTPEWCPFRAKAINSTVVNLPEMRCKTYVEMCEFLSANGFAGKVPDGKLEEARQWRARRTSDAEFLEELKR